mmetsp:Transcript_38551/g.110700  ORF Transcript_38551/g.110700 Transcript_38551/m.110700 type:complete len:233 (-) Transcript_38551:347-1045(-)
MLQPQRRPPRRNALGCNPRSTAVQRRRACLRLRGRTRQAGGRGQRPPSVGPSRRANHLRCQPSPHELRIRSRLGAGPAAAAARVLVDGEVASLMQRSDQVLQKGQQLHEADLQVRRKCRVGNCAGPRLLQRSLKVRDEAQALLDDDVPAPARSTWNSMAGGPGDVGGGGGAPMRRRHIAPRRGGVGRGQTPDEGRKAGARGPTEDVLLARDVRKHHVQKPADKFTKFQRHRR